MKPGIMTQTEMKPIGIFDSGLGGLTVFKQIKNHLPGENLIYFGDTARVPYGTKSSETVKRYAREIVEFLLQRDVKMIVAACNTVSALALDEIRQSVSVPILGVIKPGAKSAVRASSTGRIGIIGTRATVDSGAYGKEIRNIESTAKTFSLACPIFVPLAEEGWYNNEVARKTAEIYLTPMKDNQIDVLILGCTHYPVFKTLIGEVLGEKTSLIDSAVAVASAVEEIVEPSGNSSQSNGSPEYSFFVTDESQRFRTVGRIFLGEKLERIQLVKL